jgi:hypothetical protein
MEDKNKHVRERLLKDHSPSEFGTWRILGEDPNCDLGGAHHEPELETVTGTYANVVEYAMTLGSFFQWGAGGRIKKVSTHHKNIDKVFNNPRIKQLEKERAEMQARLKVIEQELQVLNEGK